MRQNKVVFRQPVWLLTLVVLALLAAACQPAAQSSNPGVPVTGKTTVPTASVEATNAAGTSGGSTAATEVPTVGASSTVTDTVTVKDQAIKDGAVTVAHVTSIADAWIVIHADENGKPGAVLGYAAIKAGDNKDVVVKIDAAKATPVLYAMLHKDVGKVGTYEFPGADTPIMIDGNMIAPSFKVTGGGASSASSSSAKGTPSTTGSTSKSTSGAASGAAVSTPTAAAAKDGSTGTGASPAPTAAATSAPASSAPASSANAPQEVKLSVRDSQNLGKYLTDDKGMTLYLYTKDPKGSSACEGGCLENWPPLLVAKNGKVTINLADKQSKIGTITRPDGTTQVTYNDSPLYYYVKDTKAGDANGQAVDGAWFVVSP